jgi:hypothetical protein
VESIVTRFADESRSSLRVRAFSAAGAGSGKSRGAGNQQMMDAESFDWKSGRVESWDLGEIDESRPLGEQTGHLKEDLGQVSFPGGIVLDIGWSPSFDNRWVFKFAIIRDGDWEAPVFRAEAGEIPSLRHQITLAIAASA